MNFFHHRWATEASSFRSRSKLAGLAKSTCEQAVANAAKHARPTQVELNLQYFAVGLELRIREKGCGFDPNGSETMTDKGEYAERLGPKMRRIGVEPAFESLVPYGINLEQ